MEVTPNNIIVNSCEYTPVYLIPSTGVTQAGSYIITQSTQDVQKPVTDNLKRFYENSGNLDNGILSSPKPRILKKQSTASIGNNLKLASFLLPKSEPTIIPTKQYIAPINKNNTNVTNVNNVVLKPTVAPVPVTTSANVVNMVPRVEVDRKIVRVGTIPFTNRMPPQGRVLQKYKPKEITTPNPARHTSVQLLKLGQTYHSLNQLSADQMKIVNQALKIFSDPEKIAKEPAYDPVTNTKFIYKVVSPRDLTVVGKNKIPIRTKRSDIVRKQKEDIDVDKSPEPKVTRSGRTVKLPKQIVPETSHKPRKKNGSVVTCFQCSAEFCSLYRLQRHYETYPTHIPAKIHTNLFHCLLAIIKAGSEDDQAVIFIQQLEQLIETLRALLPCLTKVECCEGKQCTINDDIGRLFGINPGKYQLNMSAINCVKSKDGHCIHNPAPKNNQFSSDVSKPSQIWLSKHNEEIANNEAGTEDCARINSVDKWPTVSKRIWNKHKQKKSEKIYNKKIRLISEGGEQIILDEIDTGPFINLIDTAVNVGENETISLIEDEKISEANTGSQPVTEDTTSVENQSKKPKAARKQFHSTHFDIRSSPIKPSSLARKFQLDASKLSTFEVQIMQPLIQNECNENVNEDVVMDSNSETNIQIQDILDNEKNEIPQDLQFDTSKIWVMAETPQHEQSHDSYMKSNIFDPSLTPVKNNVIEPSLIHLRDKLIFDECSKTDTFMEPILIQAKSNALFEQTPIHIKDTDSIIEQNFMQKSNSMVEPCILQLNDKTNGLFEPKPIHVNTDSNSLIEPNMIVKSSSLVEPCMMRVNDKSNSLFESTLMHSTDTSNGLFEDKSRLFDAPLLRTKDRASNLFESNLPHKNHKNSLIGSLMDVKDKSELFGTTLHRTDDMIDTTMLDMKDRCNNLIEHDLLHLKDKSAEDMDLSHSDHLNTNDNNRLMSNQGQSVLNLNFLETLGNELAYSETEIRNNAVDFQLDLFSFNSS